MKMSELPYGTVVEVTKGVLPEERYEKASHWNSLLHSANFFTLEDLDRRDDVKIISVPYEVTLQLATWLDNVYTKTGNPESLVIEAAKDAQADKHTAHISDRPKKGVE